MSTEVEKVLSHLAAQQWGKAQTRRVYEELQKIGLLKWQNVGKTWPYLLACDFYQSHSDCIYSRQEATLAIRRHARNWDVSEEFVFCLFALGYLAQDTIAYGFAMAVALSNSVVIREPFVIVYTMGWEMPFWIPAKEGK